MKHVLRYSLLGLLAFLLSLLLLAPATLVTDLLAQRLTGFSVQAVEGLATEGSERGAFTGAASGSNGSTGIGGRRRC